MIRLIRAHPVALLLILTFALTWAVWLPRAAGVRVGLLGQAWTWAPALAAVIAAALTGGRPALRDLGSRLVRWRVGWLWYLAVIVGPAVFSVAVAGVYSLFGGSFWAAMPKVLALDALPVLPLLLLILAGTDGLGEEPAWRGFALPRLLGQFNPLTAALILGAFWALWHLPLLWTPGAISREQLPWWLLLLDVPAKSVLFAWVFLHTRGSLLIAVLLHGSTNLFTVSPAIATAGTLLLPIIATSAKWVLIGVLIAAAGARLTRDPSPETRMPLTLMSSPHGQPTVTP